MEFDNITGEIEKQKSNRVAELRNKYVSEGKNEKEIKTLIENDSEIVDFDKQLEKASNFNKEELKRQLSKIDTTYDSVKYDFDI